jgi:hypothetical protein
VATDVGAVSLPIMPPDRGALNVPDRRTALLLDARLTDQARVLGLFIASLGDGAHEIAHDDFAMILHGTPGQETIRRHLRQLEVFRYVERSAGGRGHSDSYRFLNDSPASDVGLSDRSTLNVGLKPAEKDRSSSDVGLKNRPTQSGDLNASSRTRDHGDQKTSSPSSPSPSAGARTPGTVTEFDRRALEKLKQHLGPQYSESASLMAELCPTNIAAWASSVCTLYLGEHPTDPLVQGVPPPERPQKVAMALTHYAAAEKPYASKLFQGFLRDVISGKVDDDTGSSTRVASRGGRAPAAVGGEVPAAYAAISE